MKTSDAMLAWNELRWEQVGTPAGYEPRSNLTPFGAFALGCGVNEYLSPQNGDKAHVAAFLREWARAIEGDEKQQWQTRSEHEHALEINVGRLKARIAELEAKLATKENK